MSEKLRVHYAVKICLLSCAASLGVSSANAESSASLTLGFEDPDEWTLVEGSGQLEASELTTDGSAALFVGGSNWRRIASVPLSTVGAATNALKIDVAPQGAPVNWENVGVVLEIPSKGIYWSDLGTASLQGLTPGQYTTLAFPISESLRTTLNTVYDDLVIRVSINSSTAVRMDNIRLRINRLRQRMGVQTQVTPTRRNCLRHHPFQT